jgi:hypothetical protein
MLVGGFNHLEKYESQWEKLSHIIPNHQTMVHMVNIWLVVWFSNQFIIIPNIWKIKKIVQPTNQYGIPNHRAYQPLTIV